MPCLGVGKLDKRCGQWKIHGSDIPCAYAIPLESRASCCSIESLQHCKASASSFMSNDSPRVQEWVLKIYSVIDFEIVRNDTKLFQFRCQMFLKLKSALNWIAFFLGSHQCTDNKSIFLPIFNEVLQTIRFYFGLFWSKQRSKQN